MSGELCAHTQRPFRRGKPKGKRGRNSIAPGSRWFGAAPSARGKAVRIASRCETNLLTVNVNAIDRQNRQIGIILTARAEQVQGENDTQQQNGALESSHAKTAE